MSPRARRAGLSALGLLLLTGLSSCALTWGGYDGDVGLAFGGGYYQPYGYDYGGWGPGYHVGPGRGGPVRGGGPGNFRAASRQAPSIPNGSRGGSRGRR